MEKRGASDSKNYTAGKDIDSCHRGQQVCILP